MAKYLSLILLVALLPAISAVYIDANSLIINTTVSNSSITFSLNCSLDYLEVAPTGVYILNATTPIRFCPVINWTEENSNLDSSNFCLGTGTGGSSYVPPTENITTKEIRCGWKSIETLGVCLTMTGNAVWAGYPNAGILVLVMLIYIVLLLLAINGLLNNVKIYLKISFYFLLALVGFIIFIWTFSDCQVNQLGDIGMCVNNFGNKIWPGYPSAGILLLGILLVVILIIAALSRQRRKDVKTKKE